MTDSDTSTPILPRDILYLIIEHAAKDVATLFKLCLVCRALLHQAQRVLYTDISLVDTGHDLDGGAPGKKITMFRFFDTVTTHSTLAQYVRSFSYHGRELWFGWWQRMNWALQSMIHLRSFALEGSQVPVATVLFKGCTFQLREFTWKHLHLQIRPPPEEQSLRDFLSTQNEIRFLSTSFMSTRVLPIVCPSLNTLVGDTHTIMKVLPDRETVTKLIWVAQWESVFDINVISSALSHVRTLSLEGHVPPRASLATYVPYLGGLQRLQLIDNVPPTTLGEELEHIASLPRLRIFTWSPSQLYQSEYRDLIPNEQQRALVTRWFQAISSFQTAYFARCSPKEDPNCYLRWTRDGAEAHVTFDEMIRDVDIDLRPLKPFTHPS
ncbi:hypothetical protein D9756_007115 [Leucocoprinus leucothites]|uniref:F-box domain-containing protein n=1 Tax=Leucocoprinus leucothites TaxID=201217 RepID=A0A8H5FYQ8_9AGAR|nr:hypothetical protein D9756_007115 [Leucoagaricus leucothites]